MTPEESKTHLDHLSRVIGYGIAVLLGLCCWLGLFWVVAQLWHAVFG